MRHWLREILRSGTIASLVMMPAGLAFQAMGWRIGHYGPKFAALWIAQPGPAVLFVQHLVIGWVSTWPLLWLMVKTRIGQWSLAAGAGYGIAYYVAVNSLALPLAFGDPLPWQLGARTVLPSLLVHLIFGASIGLTARRFVLTLREGRP